MTKVPIGEFRKHLKEKMREVGKEPIALTKHGNVVAIIVSSSFFDDLLASFTPSSLPDDQT